jgi:hypothetical protein
MRPTLSVYLSHLDDTGTGTVGTSKWCISGTRNNNEMCGAAGARKGAGAGATGHDSELLLHHTQSIIEVMGGFKIQVLRYSMLRPVQ